MRKRQGGVPLIWFALAFFLFSQPTSAVDLNYYPQKDTGQEKYREVTPPEKVKLLPGQRPSEVKPRLDFSNTTNTDSHPKHGNEPENTSEPDEGWSVKAPSVTSDNSTFVRNQREAVRRAEEKMREDQREDGDDPLNPENYRITIEAEYKF